jgi:hypothetical protein
VELIILQVDIPLLYQPVTDQAIENAYTFYGIWWEAPGAIKVSLDCHALQDFGSMRCASGQEG